jgi:hypothetical protein
MTRKISCDDVGECDLCPELLGWQWVGSYGKQIPCLSVIIVVGSSGS